MTRPGTINLRGEQERRMGGTTIRHVDDYHEDFGPVMWWHPGEAPFCGSPLGDDWPGYHQYWTPLPSYANDIMREIEDRLAYAKGNAA